MSRTARCGPVARHPSILFLVSALALISSATRTSTAPSSYENVPGVPSAWSVRFDQSVVWQRVTTMGTLVINTAGGLYGVEPDSGKVVWSHAALADAVEEKYQDILGTPFIVAGDAAERTRVVILDSGDGRILFDSRAAGFSAVLGHHVFPQAGTLLVVALRENELTTFYSMFDIATGERLWISDRLGMDGGKFMKALAAFVQASTKDSGLRGEPVEVGPETFVMISAGNIFKIATRAGNVLWKVTEPFLLSRASLSVDRRRPDLLLAGGEVERSIGSSNTTSTETFYGAYRLSDGGRLWKEPASVKGGLNEAIFTDRGVVISPRTQGEGRIKLVDYTTGESLWGKKGKGIEILGGIIDHDESKAGIVLTTGHDSAWTDKGPQYFLNVLDVTTGTLRFKAPVKVKGRILETEALASGILFITTSEAGILDLNTGQPLSAEAIESKESLITTRRGKFYLAFSTEQGFLFLIDREKGSIRRMSKQPVQLQYDETPIALEVTRESILLTSNQNLVAFGLDGSLKFHAHHPAPRHSGIMRALLMANALRAGMAAFATGATSGAFAGSALQQQQGSAGRNLSGVMAQGMGEVSQAYAGLSSAYWKAARTRFTASAVSGDYAFMMVQLARSDYGLAAVSKKTGQIGGIISMGRDREPSYCVDAISNRVYYRLNPGEIVSYRPAAPSAAEQQARSDPGAR